MAAKGYCVLADISGYLGMTLSAAQQTEATNLIPLAEAYIDRYTRRAWLSPAILAEQYKIYTPTVYLKQHPVGSIQRVQTRTTAINDVLYLCVAGVDYELQDTATGRLVFSKGYADWRGKLLAYVDYTPSQPVPGDINLVAAMLCAHWLVYQIDPQRYGLSGYNLGRDVEVKVGQSSLRAIPLDAQAILDGYSLPVFA